jgi:aldose 1-epimerase
MPPELFSSAELARIHALPEPSYAVFRLKSPSGDQGFPGALAVEALIALVSPEKTRPMAEYSLGSIVLVYRAKLEDTKVVTPVNLTQVGSFVLLAFKFTLNVDHVALGF